MSVSNFLQNRFFLPAALLVLSGAATPAVSAATTAAKSGWTPAVTDTWEWQLQGKLKTTIDAKVYDIDLFDNTAASIAALKANGRHVVCYFSAGSSENWRPDYSKFLTIDKGKAVDGWKGENWLDTRSPNVRVTMKARLDLAVTKGCDGVEPDNVDGYTNKPGFPLTTTTQLDYNRFLATEAHARGLKVALKNDIDQVIALAPYFDLALNEQCHQYSECSDYSAFVKAGKPVFNAEYSTTYVTNKTKRDALCASSRAANIRTLVLPLNLDASFRLSCD